MKQVIWLILLFTLVLTGCNSVNTSKLTDLYNPAHNEIFKESITIRNKRVPLPPGDWKVIASGTRGDFFRLYLLQEHQEKLFSSIYIAVDTLELNREGGYKNWKDLSRNDIHHVSSEGNISGEAQSGWIINNNIMTYLPKKEKHVRNQAISYIKDNGYALSNDNIVAMHRVTGEHPNYKRYLHVNYYYNPETEGFSPGPKASWSTSDWNAARVHEDPRKVDYINELIARHEKIHKQMKAGFHK